MHNGHSSAHKRHRSTSRTNSKSHFNACYWCWVTNVRYLCIGRKKKGESATAYRRLSQIGCSKSTLFSKYHKRLCLCSANRLCLTRITSSQWCERVPSNWNSDQTQCSVASMQFPFRFHRIISIRCVVFFVIDFGAPKARHHRKAAVKS